MSPISRATASEKAAQHDVRDGCAENAHGDEDEDAMKTKATHAR
jgi:hypothetical protein